MAEIRAESCVDVTARNFLAVNELALDFKLAGDACDPRIGIGEE
jgi:hypothetical protein